MNTFIHMEMRSHSAKMIALLDYAVDTDSVPRSIEYEIIYKRIRFDSTAAVSRGLQGGSRYGEAGRFMQDARACGRIESHQTVGE